MYNIRIQNILNSITTMGRFQQTFFSQNKNLQEHKKNLFANQFHQQIKLQISGLNLCTFCQIYLPFAMQSISSCLYKKVADKLLAKSTLGGNIKKTFCFKLVLNAS
jgi:hypothetical protein